MNTPDPLPLPGHWIVTTDGSQYQVVGHCGPDPFTVGGSCSTGWADDAGVYIYSTDADETVWTPWADVDSIHADPDAAQLRADEISAEWSARWEAAR